MWMWDALMLWIDGKRSRALVLSTGVLLVVCVFGYYVLSEPARISAAYGDFAVYRESTGLELIGTSVVTLDWDTTVSEGAGFSIDSGKTDITLADAGYYLVLYNLAIGNSAGSNRSEVQGFLEFNGSVIPYGRTSCFIRRANGQNECSMAGAAIVRATSTSQVLRVQAQRTDSNSATVLRRAGASGISILRLDDIWPYARVRVATGGQTYNSSTFTAVNWDTNDQLDSGFSRSGSDITLAEPGNYLVTFNIAYTVAANARRNLETRLTLNGYEPPGSIVTAFTEGNTNARNFIATWVGIVTATTTNQVLRVEGRCEQDCGSTTIVGNRTAITIAKLPEKAEIVRLGEVGGGQAVDASNDPITWDTQYAIASSTFSHSTSTNTSRLVVDVAGDYLFFGSFFADRTLVTTNYLYPSWDWRVNTSVQNYGSFGQVHRGTAGTPTAGNSAGFLAYNVSASDYVELANTDRSTGSDSSAAFVADRMTLQGVRIASLIVADVEVTATGTMTATTSSPANDVYLGGTFVLKANRGDETVTDITITEYGTVNAATGLENIRLYYDLDTTAPHNCASETFSGSEPQFGATSTAFSSANGTSTFSGSVGIGTTTTMCVYVVLDVTESTADTETIRVRITDASSDVVIASGNVDPEGEVALSGAVVIEDDVPVQRGYHFRNDDGSEALATSATGGNENTPLTGLPQFQTTRIRLQVVNEGSVSTPAISYRLEYAPIAGTCAASTGWSTVGTTSGAFVMSPSPNLADGDDTTNIATSTGGVSDPALGAFVTPNGGVRDTLPETGSIIVSSDDFVEFEFAIEATASSTEGTTYCFRLTDTGSALSRYDHYPQATIAADVVVSAIGSMTSNVVKNTNDFYVGGAFVIQSESGSRDITDITIYETGTVDGSTGLANIRLLYDLDTSAPYDCASESYSGGEAQFGVTDTNGFSGANGSSTFSGSVGIGTTTTMCVYVVLDVTQDAQNAETIAIEIQNPSTDVISTGSVAPSTPVSLAGDTTIVGEYMELYGYHWRYDTGTEATSTSATGGSEDVPLLNASRGVTYRLRVGIQNTGAATSSAKQLRVEWGVKGTSCASVSTWTDVGGAGGKWMMSETPRLLDGTDTTNVAVSLGGITDPSSGMFITPNSAVKDVSSQTAGITFVEEGFVEVEYALEATIDALTSEVYCFRVTNAGVPLEAYGVYAEATVRPNQDFFVQRGVTTIGSGTTTGTIVAGTDYTAPSDPSRAFIRITNTHHTGAGHDLGGGNQPAADVTARIANPSNLAQSINFVRFGTTANTRVAWEIVEYIGPPGGDNEIIVRDAGSLSFTTTDLTATTSVSGVANNNKVVVFVTGAANPSTAQTSYQSVLTTGAWNGTTSTLTLTRGIASSNAINVSYALVEFTGVNWKIQRVSHNFTAAGVEQTQSITPVNDVSRAFLHVQKQVNGTNNGLDEFGHEVWLSTTTVSFFLESTATTPSQHVSVAWVIENTQTSGTPMIVTRSQGTQSTGIQPYIENVNIGKTLARLDASSIFMVNRTNGTGTTYPRAMISARLISTTQYEIWISYTGQTRTYRTEVVEWPTAQRTLTQNYYRWYVDNDALLPSDPWPSGGVDLGENTAIISGNAPPTNGTRLRVRMSLAVSHGPLVAEIAQFGLQFAERTATGTCSALVEWRALGEVGSTTTPWRAANGTPPAGTALSGNPPAGGDLLLSVSDRAGTYQEGNPSALNPFRVSVGEDVEYDWLIEHNGAPDETVYCFRMVYADGSPLDEYLFYPTLTTGGFNVESREWQWFSDVNTLTPTSSLAAENVAPVAIAYNQPIKLRLSVREIENGSSPAKFKLQFSESSDFSVVYDVIDTDQCVEGESQWCYFDGAGDEGVLIDENVLSGTDSCVGGVGDGCGTHNEYSYIPTAIGEVGTVTATSGTQVISLINTYTNPVFIAEAITGDVGGGSGNRPAAAIIVATSTSSFTLRIQEPDNESDAHGIETVSYIVMEAGAHTLPGGVRVDAGYQTMSHYYGNAVTGASDGTCTFTQTFTSPPVLLTALQSDNNIGAPDFLTASQYNVTSSSFNCSIEVPDGETNAPGSPEVYGWIAFERGEFTNNGIRFLSATTTTTVEGWANTPWHIETFPSFYFTSVPSLVASKQTRNGGDGGWVRYDELTSESVRLAIDERDDGERFNTTETVGYLAFSGAGALVAAGPATYTFAGDTNPEFEFTLRHAGAHPNTTYFFRAFDVVNNDPVTANASSTYPSLSTEGTHFTFMISGIAAASSLQGIVTNITTTATSVPFGSLAFGTTTAAAQRLSIDTNAPRGYQVFAYQRQLFESGGGAVIPDITASNSAPLSWSAACAIPVTTGCWGYRTGDATLSGGSTRFLIHDRYAALATVPEEIAYSPIPTTTPDEVDVVYRLEVTNLQPAGRYQTDLVFIAVPTF